MSIKGMEGLSDHEIIAEVERGARFVTYLWCVSILIMTFKRSSDVHFVRAGQSTFFKSLPYSLLTLVAGWWGIPWGPIYSLESLFRNSSGGIDVTEQVIGRPVIAVAQPAGPQSVPGMVGQADDMSRSKVGIR